MKNFSTNLKKLRTKFCISKVCLAKELNVSATTINSWEKGKNLPNIFNLYKICKFFDYSSDKILEVESLLYYISNN